MYEARFTTKQIYDNYAKSVSKPKNANQQAATTMKSAGIGSLGGKTTTASAKSIQDSFKEKRERRRKNKGSTYDEVPQVLTQGIVQKPKAKPVKEKGYEKVIRVFNNAMERFGIFDEPTSTYDTVKPQNVYKSSFFSVPKVTTTTLPDMVPTTPSPYRPLPSGPDTRNFGINIGADSSPEKPDSAKLDIFDILNTKEKVMRGGVPGLMSPPTIDQTKPETPGFTMEDAVNRAILATTKEYVIKPGDNLTKIAKRYNTTVKDLVQINKIENKNRIYAGESLRVPKDSVKDIKEAVLRVSTRGDEDPEKQFYQSGVPMDQRIFEPELGEGMDNVLGYDDVPQMVTGLMSKTNIVKEDFDTSDVKSSRVSYESVKKVQKRLNDLGYTTVMGDLEVDGKLGSGTARQLRKFQAEAGLPTTAASGQPVDEATLRALKNNKFNNKESKDPKAKSKPLSEGLFQQIKAPIAKIESGGEAEPYAAIGGDARDYDGKYQFGWRAKQDLRNNPAITDEERAKLFHVEGELNEDDPSRAAYRADPNLQEKGFRLYINQNHDTLTKNSAKYRAMDEKNKLAVLAYAHNQGAEAALEWLATTVSGTDAFGTRGDKYSEAVVKELKKKKKGK